MPNVSFRIVTLPPPPPTHRPLYFLKCTHPRYIKCLKCLFTSIQKQQIMLKNSLPFKKNTKAVNYSSSSGMKNTEFSEYYFYLNPEI